MRLSAVGKVVFISAKLSSQATIDEPVQVALQMFAARNTVEKDRLRLVSSEGDAQFVDYERKVLVAVPPDVARELVIGDEIVLVAFQRPLDGTVDNCSECGAHRTR